MVNPVVDPPLGNSDHSSISFSVKMGFKIPNITFSHKVYLKLHVDWPRVKIIKRKVNDKVWFNGDCVNAFHIKQNVLSLITE